MAAMPDPVTRARVWVGTEVGPPRTELDKAINSLGMREFESEMQARALNCRRVAVWTACSTTSEARRPKPTRTTPPPPPPPLLLLLGLVLKQEGSAVQTAFSDAQWKRQAQGDGRRGEGEAVEGHLSPSLPGSGRRHRHRHRHTREWQIGAGALAAAAAVGV